jgi:hypothetical protein
VNTAVAASAAPAGDWLLVNVAPGWESIAILRGAQLIFFRSHTAEGEGTLADVVHQTGYYSMKSRFHLRRCGRGCRRGGRVAAIAGRTAVHDGRHHRSDCGGGLTDRIVASGALLDTLTPLVGLLLRSRRPRDSKNLHGLYNTAAVRLWLVGRGSGVAATAFIVARSAALFQQTPSR